MANKAIPRERIEIARMDYLSSAIGLRGLAEKHGISARILADRSKREGWAEERNLQRVRNAEATMLPALIVAADERARRVDVGWRDRIEGICNTVSEVATRAGRELNKAKLEKTDWKDLASLLKILTDTLNTLRGMLPAEATGDGDAGGVTIVVRLANEKDIPHG